MKKLTALLLLALLALSACSPDDLAATLFAPVSNQPVSEPEQPKTARLSFAGDFLVHNVVSRAAAAAGENAYNFTSYTRLMQPYIKGDLNVTNFEGAIDAYGGNKNITSYPLFNAPIEILDTIKFLGFNVLTTANNHAFDKGWGGLLKTRENVLSREITPLGTFESEEHSQELYIRDVNGIKIGMTAWTAHDNGMSSAVGNRAGWAMKQFNQDDVSSAEKIVADVERLQAAGADYTIVFLHWGIEYQDSPTSKQRLIAARLAEAGVDLVVGGHPHCVQPIEWIGETLVVYSLGNFFADQIDLSSPIPKTQYGMLVSVDIRLEGGVAAAERAEYLPTFFYRENGRYLLAPAEDSAANAELSPTFRKVAEKALAHVRRVANFE